MTMSRIVTSQLSDAPDWAPLEQYVDWPSNWMWMGRYILASGVLVNAYKHGITRDYVNIGSDGRFYRYHHGIDGEYHPLEDVTEPVRTLLRSRDVERSIDAEADE